MLDMAFSGLRYWFLGRVGEELDLVYVYIYHELFSHDAHISDVTREA